jgi:hypothetical protein
MPLDQADSACKGNQSKYRLSLPCAPNLVPFKLSLVWFYASLIPRLSGVCCFYNYGALVSQLVMEWGGAERTQAMMSEQTKQRLLARTSFGLVY